MIEHHNQRQGVLVLLAFVIFTCHFIRAESGLDGDNDINSITPDPADTEISPTIDEINDFDVKVEDDESEPDPLIETSKFYKSYTNEETSNYMGSSGSGGGSSTKDTSETAVANVYEGDTNITSATLTSSDNGNSTDNSTKQLRTIASCLIRESVILNETVIEPTVEIVNFTKLIQDVLLINTTIKTKTTPGNCSIVFFYAHWCKFSAKAAPHYNALARTFPSIRTVAVNTQLYSSISSHFGVLAVPSVLLFHNGKTIAKFNDSIFTLKKFAEFIQYYTDQKCDEKLLNVTSKDFNGPIPSVPSLEKDIWLLISWIFIIICFMYYISRSTLWRKVVDLIRTTWREAEAQAQHEHMD